MGKIGRLAGLWDEHVLPGLIERACKSHAILDERKRAVPRATGHVLEVGVGSGLNFGLYDPKTVTDVVGIDPSAPLLERARERMAGAKVSIDLVRGFAETMPFDAARFDSALITYTLCSVTDPRAALAEVRRVLRPGGLVIFIEHGAAPDENVRRWQERITPLWRRVGGNCHLARDVEGELESAGFVIQEMHASYTEDSPRWLSFTYEGVATNA